jgi:enoyl-CoA hydratase/carnithine racemase
MDASIAVARDGAIATVVLNRPDKLNALTKSMWHDLGTAIGALSAVDDLRCIIVRGAGEKAFSPGNDIGEFATERANKRQAIGYGEVMRATAEALAACRHPLVAQIHGICVGGGLEIAALCDLRICGASSRFGAPIKNLGLVMAYPEMAPLVRLVGRRWRSKSCSKADLRRARGEDKGLVTRVVADEQVAARRVHRRAHRRGRAARAPLAQEFARRLADRAADG